MFTYFLVAVIFSLAGFTQGVSGFGAALVAIPLLSLVMDIKTAVPLCMLNGLIITSFLTFQLKEHLDWKKILPLFVGSLPGIFIGVLFLKSANAGVMKVLLGMMLIAYAFYRFPAQPRSRSVNSVWSYVAGFASGVIGGAFSAGGPPTVIYTTLTNWSKDDIKATLSGFFFTSGMLTAMSHAVIGITTVEVFRYFAGSLLFVLVSVYAGSVCYDRLKRETYVRVILALLIVLGILMIVTAV